MRRTAALAAAGALAVLLTACGSSSVESAFTPTRLIAFGDGFTDVGQTGSSYTVNVTDGSYTNWTTQLASYYGLTIQPVSAGGLSYAQGNARITLTPDAAGNAATPTVTQQIDTFLATQQLQSGDLVLMSGGMSDIIAGMASVNAGAQTEDEFLAAARLAGEQMAAQVRRLSNAGAKHVFVTGTYYFDRTPWAKAIGQQDLLLRASQNFNNGLLANINDLSNTVGFEDMGYFVNLFEGYPGSYGFSDSATPVCTSVDPGAGIGIGAGEVNSALCTPDTLLAGADVNAYLFADKVYITPAAQRLIGSYAYDWLRNRW
jgi:phospholipase/lecithinase/hemolysin